MLKATALPSPLSTLLEPADEFWARGVDMYVGGMCEVTGQGDMGGGHGWGGHRWGDMSGGS